MPGQGPQDNPFWLFSLDYYGRPGVAAHCLALQDEQGDDVNCLLFCCWCALQGHALQGEALAGFLTSSPWLAWREQCILPLRQVRRFLRRGEGEVADLGSQLQGLELDAEQVAQSWLYDGREVLASAAAVTGPPLLVGNLQCYRSSEGRPPMLGQDILPLLQAAFPQSSAEELSRAAAV